MIRVTGQLTIKPYKPFKMTWKYKVVTISPTKHAN